LPERRHDAPDRQISPVEDSGRRQNRDLEPGPGAIRSKISRPQPGRRPRPPDRIGPGGRGLTFPASGEGGNWTVERPFHRLHRVPENE